MKRLADRWGPERLERWSRVTAAWKPVVLGFVIFSGVLLAAGNAVLAIVSAVIGLLFALANGVFVLLTESARGQKDVGDLLEGGSPHRAGSLDALTLRIDREALPKDVEWHYVPRDCERDLRRCVSEALARGNGPPRLVMLSGHSKAGKTRMMFEALKWEELRDGWVVVPRDGKSVERLLRTSRLPKRWTPLIVWLDDVEFYVTADGGGLSVGTIRGAECDRPTVLLATEGGRGAERIRGDTSLAGAVDDLRRVALIVDVSVLPNDKEEDDIRRFYPQELADEIVRVGIGRRMVASAKLEEKIRLQGPYGGEERCREGQAVVRAALDWRRAGAQSGISRTGLERLYRHYLPDDLDAGEGLFVAGLRWARKPLPETEIALLGRDRRDRERFDPHPLAVEIAERTWHVINDGAWDETIALAGYADCLAIGVNAYAREGEKSDRAFRAWERTEGADDVRLAATGACNLGVLLERRGDLEGAEAAYRRADERGHATGACYLGVLLERRGDLEGAEAAFRRADERGFGAGAYNLGLLLKRRGDLEGAKAARERARDRGFTPSL
jgi:hypothetical protein